MNIIYINLNHRKDRLKSILNEINKLKCDTINRIEAVLEPLCGHIGCGKSHILALELAIKNDFEYVLIMEDDFVFTESLNIEKLLTIEFDVILLSKGHHHCKPSNYDFLERAYRATTTSAYIVKRHYYSTLLNNFKESIQKMENELKLMPENNKLNYCSAIDLYWFILQEKDIFYMHCIGKQEHFWSDNNCTIEFQKNKIENEIE
jgi:GR25 family glycosyltransferase involved in LPS biosynthesis